VEYCHNLIFRRRAVLDTLHQREFPARMHENRRL
jgi:hypothetical protein